VRVTDNATGCTNESGYLNISVGIVPDVPTVTDNPPPNGCGDHTLTVAAVANAASYEWYRDGSLVGTGSSYTASQGGSYYVKAINSTGACASYSSAVGVTVKSILPAPYINPNGSASGCTSVTLYTSGYSSYQWYSSGSPVGSNSSSYTAYSNGTYYVVATENGCSSSASNTTNVYITGNPAKPSINYSGSAPFCGSLALSTSSPAVSYQWLNYNSAVGGNSSSYTAGVGSGNYQVTVMDGNGCFNTSDPVSVTVYSYP
jgi:hypothetical protein